MADQWVARLCPIVTFHEKQHNIYNKNITQVSTNASNNKLLYLGFFTNVIVLISFTKKILVSILVGANRFGVRENLFCLFLILSKKPFYSA